METFVYAILFTLLGGLLLSPILLLRIINKSSIKYKFIAYLIFGTLITAILALVLAWWQNESDRILLTYYGYNFNGMSEKEFFGNVKLENMERVKKLERSIMGVGWPVKAFIAFLFYFPYLLIIYIATHLIGKRILSRRGF